MNWIIAHLVAEFLLQPEKVRLGKRFLTKRTFLGQRSGQELSEAKSQGYLNSPTAKKYYRFDALTIEHAQIGLYNVYVTEYDLVAELLHVVHALIWAIFVIGTMGWFTPWAAALAVSHYALERFDLTSYAIKILHLKTKPTDNYKLIISNILHLLIIWIFVIFIG